MLPVRFLCISALFAMEISVTKNLLTGEKTVVSTATVPAEDLKHRAGTKVYDDGRKCVYALDSQEVWSGEQESTLAILVWLILNTKSSRNQSQAAANKKSSIYRTGRLL